MKETSNRRPASRISTRQCAQVLKALADNTRLAVVRALLQGPRHVGEINAGLAIDQSLLSHHLRILRNAGLVTAARDGKAVLYRLADNVAAGPRGDEVPGQVPEQVPEQVPKQVPEQVPEQVPKQVLDLGCCRLSFEG